MDHRNPSALERLASREPETVRDLSRAVRDGAALLDYNQPGWFRQIESDRLAMHSCNECILGQLYGDYTIGFRHVLRKLPSSMRFAGSQFGFTIRPGLQGEEPDDKIMLRFEALADLWRAAIRRRSEDRRPCQT